MKGCTERSKYLRNGVRIKMVPRRARTARFMKPQENRRQGGGGAGGGSNEPRRSLQSKRGRVSSVWLRGKEPLKKSKTDKYELMVSNGVHLIYYPPHHHHPSHATLQTGFEHDSIGLLTHVGGRKNKREVYTDSRRAVCSFSGTDSGIVFRRQSQLRS